MSKIKIPLTEVILVILIIYVKRSNSQDEPFSNPKKSFKSIKLKIIKVIARLVIATNKYESFVIDDSDDDNDGTICDIHNHGTIKRKNNM